MVSSINHEKLIKQIKLFLLFSFFTSIYFLDLWQKFTIQPHLLLILFFHFCFIKKYPSCLIYITIFGAILDGFFYVPIGTFSLLAITSYLFSFLQNIFFKKNQFLTHWFKFLGFLTFYLILKRSYFFFILNIELNFLLELYTLFMTLCLYPILAPILNNLEQSFNQD